ncbi:methylated-DNA--[protein]-cysteine S-methyltransferase [Metabacillus sp. RGM 3146]|uniref:methylated-DNA--[protein]-cysteine S-methyltransferase n=1 Tax=Metabacillus sp. RGM 3146 TaxID=3401092 RepID=UPI003B9C7FE9
MYKLNYESPIGMIEIQGTEKAISAILFSEKEHAEYKIEDGTPPVLKDCFNQLDEYFRGERTEFTFPLIIEGTAFQKTVWNSLNDIPFAETGSYKDIALLIGNEKAVRAVGNANGKNKICIVIPCHRIIGSNSKLTGYAGGLWRKEWLLEHEKKHRTK